VILARCVACTADDTSLGVLDREEDDMEAAEDEPTHFETSKGVKVVASFDQMGLKEDLLR
jgi:hypothetical protein